ncbi:MAG: thiol:disulfide interchange protein DsbA/DsbL [Zoogloeaceae bacterium]|jgi:thiol:disulfide interchange protein DsbA|nr:thiol:disulfide interchange protein DsbA/DsbL [Zoogloeaceae bacterium]
MIRQSSAAPKKPQETHFSARRDFLRGAACLAPALLAPWAFPLAAHAEAQRNILPPQVTRLSAPLAKNAPDKIEVIEFFSYACGHCNDFHPLLGAWIAKQNQDVAFRRIPVAWSRAWENLARLYYTLETLGDLKRLDDAVFAALHKERRNLMSERALVKWYAEQGGNSDKFTAAFNSFGVQSKTKQGEQTREDAQVEAVPALLVEGEFLVEGADRTTQKGSFPQMLASASQLVAEARKAKKA